jgi:hypothetical protein
VEKLLGALPVVADFCQRLDLQGIVDRACPVRQVATLTHGQVICALVANRLTSPTPLLRVEDWARAWAVTEVFGIVPEALNDDRVGRALDAIAPKLDAIVGSVGARAIAAFGLQVARLHWDMTVRHEVRGDRVGGKDPPLGCRSSLGEAGGSLAWEAPGRVGAAPTTTRRAGTARRLGLGKQGGTV